MKSTNNSKRKGLVVALLVGLVGVAGLLVTAISSANNGPGAYFADFGSQFDVNQEYNFTVIADPVDLKLDAAGYSVLFDPEYIEVVEVVDLASPVPNSILDEKAVELDGKTGASIAFFSTSIDVNEHLSEPTTTAELRIRTLKEGTTTIEVVNAVATENPDGGFPVDVDFAGDSREITIGNTIADNTPPSTPTGITATLNQSADRINVSWSPASDPESNIARYELFVNEDTVPVYSGSETSREFTSVEPGVEYRFAVQAVNGVELKSTLSEVATVIVPDPGNQPDEPGNISAAPISTGTEVALTWDAVSEAAFYRVYADQTDASTLFSTAPITDTTYQLTGLTPGSEYFYRVVAVEEGGAESNSTVRSFTTSEPSIGDNAVEFRLESDVNGEVKHGEEFEVVVRLNNPGLNRIPSYSFKLFFDDNVFAAPETTDLSYTICTDGRDGFGNSVVTDNGTALLIGCNFLEESQYVADSNPVLARIKVRALDQQGTGTIDFANDTGVTYAVNENFEDLEVVSSSITINVTSDQAATPPSQPLNLTEEDTTSTTASIKWLAATGEVDGYRVQRAGSDGTFAQIGEVGASTLEYTDSNLAPATMYTYRVLAYNEVGNSDPSDPLSVTTDSQVDPNPGDTEKPTVPGNLTASNITTTSVDINWVLSTDNVAVTGYSFILYRGVTGVDIVASQQLSSDITGVPISNLIDNTGYRVTLVAFDAAGNQSDVATTAFTTVDDPNIPVPTPPPTPTPPSTPTPPVTPTPPTQVIVPSSPTPEEPSESAEDPSVVRQNQFDSLLTVSSTTQTDIRLGVKDASATDGLTLQLSYQINGSGNAQLQPVTSVTDMLLEGLNPGTTYVVQLIGTDSNGQKYESNSLKVRTKGYVIEVEVVDIDGNPIANTDVTFIGDNSKGRTDENGIVTFDDVKPGDHYVVFYYNGQENRIEVSVPETAQLDSDGDPQVLQERVSTSVLSASGPSTGSSSSVQIIGGVLLVALVALMGVLGYRIYSNSRINDGTSYNS